METKTFMIAGLIIALIVGAVAVFFASTNPDGLESTALVVQGQKTLAGDTPQSAEIHEQTQDRFAYEAPFRDYSIGEGLGPTGSLIAMIMGILLAFGLIYGIARVISNRYRGDDPGKKSI